MTINYTHSWQVARGHLCGYNCYPGSGWRAYGRLVVNFHNNVVTSIYFDGVRIY